MTSFLVASLCCRHAVQHRGGDAWLYARIAGFSDQAFDTFEYRVLLNPSHGTRWVHKFSLPVKTSRLLSVLMSLSAFYVEEEEEEPETTRVPAAW